MGLNRVLWPLTIELVTWLTCKGKNQFEIL